MWHSTLKLKLFKLANGVFFSLIGHLVLISRCFKQLNSSYNSDICGDKIVFLGLNEGNTIFEVMNLPTIGIGGCGGSGRCSIASNLLFGILSLDYSNPILSHTHIVLYN
jgi:hypothetical protein